MFSKIKEFQEKLKEEPFGNRLCFCIYTIAWLLFLVHFIESIYITQTFPSVGFMALSLGYLGFSQRNEKYGEIFMYSTIITSLIANLGMFA